MEVGIREVRIERGERGREGWRGRERDRGSDQGGGCTLHEA